MNLDQLEKLAKAATPEPWDEAYILGAVRHIARNVELDVFIHDPEACEFGWDRYKDGPFIAAANPQTVLALIAVARAAGHVTAHEGIHLGEASVRWHALMNALAALEST